jgi:hypothetical protein
MSRRARRLDRAVRRLSIPEDGLTRAAGDVPLRGRTGGRSERGQRWTSGGLEAAGWNSTNLLHLRGRALGQRRRFTSTERSRALRSLTVAQEEVRDSEISAQPSVSGQSDS